MQAYYILSTGLSGSPHLSRSMGLNDPSLDDQSQIVGQLDQKDGLVYCTQILDVKFDLRQVELVLKKRWNRRHRQTLCCTCMIHPDDIDAAVLISGTRTLGGHTRNYQFVRKKSTNTSVWVSSDTSVWVLNPQPDVSERTATASSDPYQLELPISFIKTTTKPFGVSKDEATSAYAAYGPPTILTSEVYKAIRLRDIQDTAERVVNRFNFTDTRQSDAIKSIMSNLARIAERIRQYHPFSAYGLSRPGP